MSNDKRRITLICHGATAARRDWNLNGDHSTRVITMRTFPILSYALHNGVNELQQDVERVVIDRATTANGFLDLLASLPEGFTGDLLFIGDNGDAYLSATGRGGDRVLYALKGSDVDFYLATHGLLELTQVDESWTLPQTVLRSA